MKHAKNLRGLYTLSQIISDRDMSLLNAAQRARQASLDRLAELAAGKMPENPTAACLLAEFHHQQWADSKRKDINIQLARQTAEWMDAQAAARQSFGRANVLKKIITG